jgi:hypothetical protein
MCNLYLVCTYYVVIVKKNACHGTYVGLHFFGLAVDMTSHNKLVVKDLLPPSLIICRCWCACHKFDSIYRKYVQCLYLQINLF